VKLAELLREDLILTDFRARDKTEAIGKLVDHLVSRGLLREDRRRGVLHALFARESIASTGMEHGGALPHAGVDGLERALGAFALAPDGVPFQSADGLPSRLIVLLVIPQGSVQRHVRTLAAIARLLNYEEMRERLLRAGSAREVRRIIREEEEKGPPA
jgi:PTS system fructose-specific IIA component